MEGDYEKSTIAAPRKSTPSSSTTRFMGFLKQSACDPDPLELDECDVVWFSDLYDSTDPNTPSSSTVSNSPTSLPNQFSPQNSGLSAVLSDDHSPVLRRKLALNSSLSAGSDALTFSHVQLPLREELACSRSGKFRQSAPVTVPAWPKANEDHGHGSLKHSEEDDAEAEEEMVPPHVIVARSHVMTFSVFEGVGRTLKGRDLRRVRNAVFQKTGFLE